MQLQKIKVKIRSLIEDNLQKDFDTFEYVDSKIFTLSEENIEDITSMQINDEYIGSGDYDFNSTTNEIELMVTGFAEGDIIKVNYTSYKYSNNEINSYIRSALVYLSTSSYKGTVYDLDDNSDVEPTPDAQTEDLIALIASILIKPDYYSYKLPTITVVYNGRLSKEEKIQKLIDKFVYSIGIMGVLRTERWDIYE